VVEMMERLPGRDPGDGFFAAVLRNGQVANATEVALYRQACIWAIWEGARAPFWRVR